MGNEATLQARNVNYKQPYEAPRQIFVVHMMADQINVSRDFTIVDLNQFPSLYKRPSMGAFCNMQARTPLYLGDNRIIPAAHAK